jgi:hypothetical protein
MWAASGLCRQIPADAAASQLCKPCTSALPLFPGDGAQPPPEPFVKPTQHRRRLTEAEVAAPPDEVDGQFLDDLRKAASARAPRQFPDPCFEAGERLRRDAPSPFASGGKAEAKEFADARFGDRALGLVDLQPEALRKEPFDASHHPFFRTLAAHIDVAVVGVPNPLSVPYSAGGKGSLVTSRDRGFCRPFIIEANSRGERLVIVMFPGLDGSDAQFICVACRLGPSAIIPDYLNKPTCGRPVAYKPHIKLEARHHL